MKVRLKRLGILLLMTLGLFVLAMTTSAVESYQEYTNQQQVSSQEKDTEVMPLSLDLIPRPTVKASTPIYIENTLQELIAAQEISNSEEESETVVSTEPLIEETEPTEETIVEETEPVEEEIPEEPKWDGPVLDAYVGTVQGPSGKETYYDLPMSGVIAIMEDLGYVGDEWYFWIREDGVKMYGKYIMCAASLDIRPKGTIIETSLGTAMVCDTGGFAKHNKYQLDIATDWTNRNGY